MLNLLSSIKKKPNMGAPLLPLIAFIVPLLWLYFLDSSSFEAMWKGRTFQLFFVWLIALELILGWENFKETKITKLMSARTIAVAVAMILPTLYVAASFNFGLNNAIFNWSTVNNIKWASSMPLSTEYLAFTGLFCLVAFLALGKKGVLNFSIPAFFMGIVGALYTIDNVFPYGQFTPFQFFVQPTAYFAERVLNFIGYQTSLSMGHDIFAGAMPTLSIANQTGTATFQIAWPCAGIESLLIFTVVTLLFLKRMPISWKAKIGYFTFGAAVTYFINILRIVTIFTIGLQYGETSSEVSWFHLYYGPLYSISWIIIYPLLIFGSQNLWQRFRSKKPVEKIAGTLPIK